MTINFNKQLLKLSHSFLKQLPKAISEIEHLWQEIYQSDWKQEEWGEVQKQFIGIKENCKIFGYRGLNNQIKDLTNLFEQISNIGKCTIQQKKQITIYINEIKEEVDININEIKDIHVENYQPVEYDDYTEIFIYQNNQEIPQFELLSHNRLFHEEKSFFNALESSIPRCIIIDIKNPNIDFPIAEKIVKSKIVENCNIPTIFIIDSSDFSLQLKIAKIGSLALTRPLDSKKLEQAVAELCPTNKQIPKILVIDSDTACATFYSLLLKTFGLKTEAATDQIQAIKSVANFNPDIILIDFHFDDDDAINIAREIREFREHTNTPIIFISSETKTQKQFEAMQYGDDFIAKPITAEMLVNLIRVWLQFKNSKIQHSSVRLNRQKFVSQVNSKEKEVKEAQSTLVSLETKIKQLEKEIGDIKQLPESSEIPRNTVIPGTKGNSYTIESVMARGGMSITYVASENITAKKVVVKVLSPEYSSNVKDAMRFLQEAETIAKLDHPNLIKGYDYFQSSKICYIVMEYISGTSVMEMIDHNQQLSPKYSLETIKSISYALKYMEAKGLVHRDIKPEHILVTKDGTTKLIDFGILKTTERPCSLTTVGVVLGTPYYMSPEQIYQSEIDIRSDIYCLGATLFHMLTGSVPFDGETPIDVMQKRLFSTPDPRQKNKTLSNNISQLVQKMMSKELKLRHNCVDELISHIEEVQKSLKQPQKLANQKTERLHNPKADNHS
ncbi:protein kinase [Candidatus Uabimicrobium sp. HlEnr_7]|uniref:protein kinase domain-containing protein n=1 Tax=Candidatus Uabimicrobium helgolandensis TaxID=3095367 RepID=UPI0035576992